MTSVELFYVCVRGKYWLDLFFPTEKYQKKILIMVINNFKGRRVQSIFTTKLWKCTRVLPSIGVDDGPAS